MSQASPNHSIIAKLVWALLAILADPRAPMLGATGCVGKELTHVLGISPEHPTSNLEVTCGALSEGGHREVTLSSQLCTKPSTALAFIEAHFIEALTGAQRAPAMSEVGPESCSGHGPPSHHPTASF